MKGRQDILIEEGFRKIFNYIIDPVVIYEVDEHFRFVQILEINESFSQVYGYDKDEISDLSFSTINADSETAHRLIETIAKQGNYLFETIHKTKDGREFPVEVHSHRVEIDNVMIVISIVRDISKRKMVEARLVALNHMKDNALKIVSHDLRNPLAQINGATELLRKGETDDSKKALIEMVDTARKNAGHIIADLLKADEYRFNELNGQKLDAWDFANMLASHYVVLAKSEKNIMFRSEIPKSPGAIYANRNRLIRAFDNIISNAIKFSYPDSEIFFELKKHSDSVEFTITDHGIGIPENLQNFVFDKASKAGRPGTKGEETYGLGMFITKEIIDNHKGKIWFTTKENHGTTFHVLIPLVKD